MKLVVNWSFREGVVRMGRVRKLKGGSNNVQNDVREREG